MTSPAVAAILGGMPYPGDLRVQAYGEMSYLMAGPVVLASYRDGDLAMRNIAVAVARRLGFPGKVVAAVMGLTPSYVATLHQRALREGAAGLARPSGPKPKLGPADWAMARTWREAGAAEVEVAARLGVAQSTVSRHLGGGQQQLPSDEEPGQQVVRTGQPTGLGEPAEPDKPHHAAAPGAQAPESAQAREKAEPGEPARGPGQPARQKQPAAPGVPAGEPMVPREPAGTVRSRYAGAMLLHAFSARAGASRLLAAAAGQAEATPGARYGDVALLSAVSTCFALGAATIEQFKHLATEAAGPLAGLAALPGLRTLRPRLAAIADAADPLELQSAFASAMLAADPVTSGVYYVDDHFVPYTGAKPVGKGWNNKRGRAEKGRADTHISAHDGRAVCFVTGEPSGLSITLSKALAELKKAAPPGTPILLGFDRGGAYPRVFAHCGKENVHWVTWRRAPLAAPTRLPVLAEITINGKARQVAWADETTHIKDYGTARQITLFERGQPALQLLTSDADSCPAGMLSFLKSRWREENFLKYASENYGIDKICDYAAEIEANTKLIGNPARKAANAHVRDAEKVLAGAREAYAVMLTDAAIPASDKNARAIPAAQEKIARAEQKLAAAKQHRDAIPAKLPANVIDPTAQVALLRAGRRGLQMVLRLLAHNAEHWLASHLNAYLRDDDEYRAITRQTIIRGLAGTINYTPRQITVELDTPAAPRVARALGLLIEEINATPPSLPGDTRPITYRLAKI
jgi:hypothetical protein